MNELPAYKFLKGLNQKFDTDISDGLQEATDISFDKIGSIRSVKVNDSHITFSGAVHSLAMEGVDDEDVLFSAVGTDLNAGPTSVLGTVTLSGGKVDLTSHTNRLYFVDSSGTVYFYDPTLTTAQKVFKAGAPAPTGTPAASVAGVGSFNGTYNIKVTYFNAHSYDGNPSPADSTGAAANNLIDVASIPTYSGTDYTITGRKLWIQGGTTPYYPEYVLIDTINDNTTTSVTGLATTDVDTTELLETDNDTASTGYKFILNHYGVLLLAGNDQNTLAFSKATSPEQYPLTNTFTISRSGDRIMNLVSWDGVTYIPTRKKIFSMIGSPGQGILQTNFYIKDSRSRFGTIASDSVVPTPYGMFFWSEDGIRIFDGNTSEIFGNEVEDEFDGRNKNDIEEALTIGAFHDDQLIYSYASGTSTTQNSTLIYDFKTKKWSKHAIGYRSLASDQKNNVLYCGTASGIDRFKNGSSYRSWALKTQDLPLELQATSSYKNINVDMEGTCTLEAYLDGTLRKTYSLSASSRQLVERLLPNYLAQRIALRFSGSAKTTQDKIYSFQLEAAKEGMGG